MYTLILNKLYVVRNINHREHIFTNLCPHIKIMRKTYIPFGYRYTKLSMLIVNLYNLDNIHFEGETV